MKKEIKDIIELLGLSPDDLVSWKEYDSEESFNEDWERIAEFYGIPTFESAMLNSILIYRFSGDILKNLKKKKRDYIRNCPILYAPEVVTDCMEFHKRAEFLVECEIMAREHNIWEY